MGVPASQSAAPLRLQLWGLGGLEFHELTKKAGGGVPGLFISQPGLCIFSNDASSNE